MKIFIGPQCVAAAMAFVLSIPYISIAQQEGQEEDVARHEAEAYVKVLPSCSLKAQPGKVSIIASGAGYSYSFKALKELPVILSMGAQQYAIDESAPISLPTQLTGVYFGIETTVPFFKLKDSYFRLQLMPTMNTDDWGGRTSAFRMPVHAFAIYQPNAHWTWIGGIALYHDYDERVFPIAGFIYKPNDVLTFQLTPDNPHIAYRLNNKITVRAQGGLTDKEFEVTKDGLKGVILRFRETRAGAGISYKLTKTIECFFSSGYQFKRYLKYGDSLGKVNIKNGCYTELKMEMKL